MKYFLLALVLFGFGIHASAEDAPQPTPRLFGLNCLVHNLSNKDFYDVMSFDVELTDLDPDYKGHPLEKFILKKVVEIPKHPGYFVIVETSPNSMKPFTGTQQVVLRVKTKKQLPTFNEMFSSGFSASPSVSLALPGSTETSTEITCHTTNWPND